MAEQTRQEARAYGAGIATLVIVGTVAVGLGSVIFAVGMAGEKHFEAAGSGLMASAIALGFAANAIWRR